MAIKKVKVSKSDKNLIGHIRLDGSKSISNRVLIIQALCEDNFTISGLSTSDDTKVLQEALEQTKQEYNVGHAGTSFRFLTALMSFRSDTQILKGSKRMHQRPIGPLVDALISIGANIEYIGEQGYPPLKINEPQSEVQKIVRIDAGISSQFISALCLIAPTLPEGLTIELNGDIVSASYIQMTLDLMRYFGVDHTWTEQQIFIPAQKYLAKDIQIEADWSAASYYYVMASMADQVDLKISGLSEDSLQGDAQIVHIGKQLGIASNFKEGHLRLSKSPEAPVPFFENDFITHPDIAQSVAIICAALGIQGLFTGLQTLKIKETDRIAALKTELAKIGAIFYGLPAKKFAKGSGKEYSMVEGRVNITDEVEIETYKDHRMAMSFAPLAIIQPIIIIDPDVVTKSYPSFWKDLETLGFKMERS